MERYDSYKDSGVKWLGEIPSHWEVVKLKSLCKMFGRIGFRGYSRDDLVDDGEGAITLSPSNFSDGHLDFSNSSYLSWSKYYESPEIMVQNGDIVFVKTASIGKVAYVENLPVETTVNPQILVFKEIKCNAKFLSYYLQSTKIQGWIVASANGSTISTISQVSVGNYPVILPAQKVQEALVEYIDIEISKINVAIAQQQKMIDLLNERKQIIINNAVTKGLDPSVPLINSGIDWIGQIPEGWKVYKIKNLISLQTDYDANGSFSDIAKNCNINTGNPYAWMVRTTDLVNKRFGIVEGNNYCDKSTYDYLAKSSLSPGDLLMTKRGNVGNVYLVPDYDRPMTLAPNLYLLRTLRNKVNNKFLMYFLSSSKPQGQLALLNKSTTLGALYKDDVKALNVVLPPLDVQNSLVDWIEDKIIDIERAIDCIKDMISLLQERKQIIINDVVTGKVKIV